MNLKNMSCIRYVRGVLQYSSVTTYFLRASKYLADTTYHKLLIHELQFFFSISFI